MRIPGDGDIGYTIMLYFLFSCENAIRYIVHKIHPNIYRTFGKWCVWATLLRKNGPFCKAIIISDRYYNYGLEFLDSTKIFKGYHLRAWGKIFQASIFKEDPSPGPLKGVSSFHFWNFVSYVRIFFFFFWKKKQSSIFRVEEA